MSAAKQKGTTAETAVVSHLKAKGFQYVERRTLNGQFDRGDIAGIPGIVIEVKNHREMDLAGWLKEAEREKANDHADHGVVWHKKRGTTNAGEWYVTMTGESFAELLKAAGY